MKIGFDHRARRAILDEVQPHWIAAAAALAGAALSAYSQQQAAKKQQAAAAGSALAGQQGGAPQPFESVASQFARPAGGGYDPQQRVQDGLAQDNQQNEQRLRALQMGKPVSSVFSQAGAAPPAQMSPAAQQPSMMAGRSVDPTGQYSMSSVPQTTQGGGMGLQGYANLLGTAAQVGSSMRQPPPPPAGLPQQGQASNYQPTALEQLRMLMQMRQGQGRRYF